MDRVSDLCGRFDEEPVLMFDIFESAAQSGIMPDRETLSAVSEMSFCADRISSEYFRGWLEKIIMSEHPEVLEDACKTSLLDIHFPELKICLSCEQNNPNHIYSVGEHILHSVKEAPQNSNVRFAMLLHDIGKPVCRTTDEKGIDHFYGHPAVSAYMAERILKRWGMEEERAQKNVNLVAFHDREFSRKPVKFKRMMAEVGKDSFYNLLAVKRADIAAQSDYNRMEKLAKTDEWERRGTEIIENGEPVCVEELILGRDDLMSAGVTSEEIVQKTLKAMLGDVLVNPQHNTAEHLDRYVQKAAREQSLLPKPEKCRRNELTR